MARRWFLSDTHEDIAMFVQIQKGDKRMKLRKLSALLSLLVMVSMILAACAPATPEATEAPETEVPTDATEVPAAQATDRRGGWLDEIDLSVVAADSAISQLQAGTIDFFS